MTAGKQALDTIIKKSRAHFYKPTQIAEILYRNRIGKVDVTHLENYRSPSRRWRDEISLRLVGSISTSSSRFQDNVFDQNAVPPEAIIELAEINRANNGLVEAYIYKSMAAKMSDLGDIHTYLTQSGVEEFELRKLLDLFTNTPGLRRSMDKVYEIVAYGLFDAVLEALEANISISIDTQDERLLGDFDSFVDKVFRFDGSTRAKTERARVFRVGSTNANDGGLDLWSNFGPAIQVKHFTLSSAHVTSITSAVKADKFIVVCTDAEKDVISSILQQAGDDRRIQALVTLADLETWYTRIFSSYKDTIGKTLLERLLEEFEYEFPSNIEIPTFLSERGYDIMELPADWEIPRKELDDG